MMGAACRRPKCIIIVEIVMLLQIVGQGREHKVGYYALELA